MARKWSSAEELAAERANAAAVAEADRDQAKVELAALQRGVDEVMIVGTIFLYFVHDVSRKVFLFRH